MTKFDAIGIRMAKEQAPPVSADVRPGPVDGYGAACDSNTSNTAKSTVSCLVSAKRFEPPTVSPQL